MKKDIELERLELVGLYLRDGYSLQEAVDKAREAYPIPAQQRAQDMGLEVSPERAAYARLVPAEYRNMSPLTVSQWYQNGLISREQMEAIIREIDSHE